MPLSAKEYLGEESYNQLSESDQKEIDALYVQALEVYNDYSQPQEAVDEAFGKLDQKLNDLGIAAPNMGGMQGASIDDFLTSIEDKISDDEAAELKRLADEAMNAMDDQGFDAATEKMNKIIGKLGLDAKEILNALMNNNEQLGLYNVNNATISYESKNTKVDAQEDMKIDPVHKKVWDHVVKILPQSIMDRIVKFEVNTDGEANVMAHVVQETQDLAKWRLAVDLKDSVNEDGSFNQEFTNTIIHEMFHIATLNKSQMEQGQADDSQLVLQEGTLAKNSYLNLFYQKFWQAIKDEHQAEVDQQGGDSNQADMYSFYEKYASQFVSDYAATNVAEDVAETFRVFVIEDKPTGDEIKDQKVRFFYEFPELVKIRDDIRASLNL